MFLFFWDFFSCTILWYFYWSVLNNFPTNNNVSIRENFRKHNSSQKTRHLILNWPFYGKQSGKREGEARKLEKDMGQSELSSRLISNWPCDGIVKSYRWHSRLSAVMACPSVIFVSLENCYGAYLSYPGIYGYRIRTYFLLIS